MSKRKFLRGINRGKQVIVSAARLDGSNTKWGLWVSPHLWLSSETLTTQPSWWFRFWQRIFLGWRWEKR